MAREALLIHEIQQNFPLVRSMTETNHIDYIKNLLVDTLRESFAQHPDYPYIARDDEIGGPDFDRTEIVITDVYTYDVKFLPAITIRVNSSNSRDVSFNQNRFTVDYLRDDDGNFVKNEFGKLVPAYFEFAGGWESQATVNVTTEDTITREELITFLSVLLFHLKRDKLYTKGVFVKNVSIGGEAEEPYANDYLFQQSITLDLWSEWTHRLPVGEVMQCIAVSSRGFNTSEFNPTDAEIELAERTWLDVIKTCVNCNTVELSLEWDGSEWNVVQLALDWLETEITTEQLQKIVSGATSVDDLTAADYFTIIVNIPTTCGLTLTDFKTAIEEFAATLVDSDQVDALDDIVDDVVTRTQNLLYRFWS